MFETPTVAVAVLAGLSDHLRVNALEKVERGTKRARASTGDDYRAFRKRVKKRRAKKGYR